MRNKSAKLPAVTIGCDPEFFLEDENGNVISAVELVPGSKIEPYKLDSGAGLQTDNVAVEFASPIVTSGEELVKNLKETMSEISRMLPAKTCLVAKPSAMFPDKELEHPQAKEFGCSPDYNAWSLMQNEVPNDINPNFRSCGGHIHVGFVEGDGNEFLDDFEGKISMVKVMDCFHGIISVVLDSSEESIARRKLYGAAGCHRSKDYGIEYRVLSNYWLKSPELVMLQYSLVQDCLKVIREGKADDLIKAIGGEDKIVNIINEGRVDDAVEVIERYLKPNMSGESLDHFNLCKDKIGEFNFKSAWLEA